MLFAGVNLVPAGTWAQHPEAVRQVVARLAGEGPVRFASVYGQADAVLAVWEELERRGVRAQEIRPEQPLLVLTRERFLQTQSAWEGRHLPSLSCPLSDPSGEVLAASIDMFTQEVGYSPVAPHTREDGVVFAPNAQAYRERVADLLRRGRTWVATDRTGGDGGSPGAGTVAFKADVVQMNPHTAAVQGVWMRRDLRGQGLAAGCMRALAGALLERTGSVSLYVNPGNLAAVRAYTRAGFEQKGSFATVLL